MVSWASHLFQSFVLTFIGVVDQEVIRGGDDTVEVLSSLCHLSEEDGQLILVRKRFHS